jgi:hypothetical protein
LLTDFSGTLPDRCRARVSCTSQEPTLTSPLSVLLAELKGRDILVAVFTASLL